MSFSRKPSDRLTERRPSSGSISTKSSKSEERTKKGDKKIKAKTKDGDGSSKKGREKSKDNSNNERNHVDNIHTCKGCGGHFPTVLMEAHADSCTGGGGGGISGGTNYNERRIQPIITNHEEMSYDEYENVDPQELREEHHSRNQFVAPVIVIPKSTGNAYLDELNKQIEDKKYAKKLQKLEDEKWEKKKDLEIASYNPYGRPGCGAPSYDEDGTILTDLKYRHNKVVVKSPSSVSSSPPRNGEYTPISNNSHMNHLRPSSNHSSSAKNSEPSTPLARNRDKIMGSSITFGDNVNNLVSRTTPLSMDSKDDKKGRTMLPAVINNLPPMRDERQQHITPSPSHHHRQLFQNGNKLSESVTLSYSNISEDDIQKENEFLKRENRALKDSLEGANELLSIYRNKYGKLSS